MLITTCHGKPTRMAWNRTQNEAGNWRAGSLQTNQAESTAGKVAEHAPAVADHGAGATSDCRKA